MRFLFQATINILRRFISVLLYEKWENSMLVKNKIMYQATTRDYKVGDILKFGEDRNYQGERALATNYRMPDGGMAELFLMDKLKKKKKLKLDEMKILRDILMNYGFSMREIGYEVCRQQFYKDRPSRLKAMFLCEKREEAQAYLTTAKTKGGTTKPKVVGVKLNGNLFRTSNAFNARDGKSIDEFIEQAHKYWAGVDENFENKASVEYLFEGVAEVVEIIEF